MPQKLNFKYELVYNDRDPESEAIDKVWSHNCLDFCTRENLLFSGHMSGSRGASKVLVWHLQERCLATIISGYNNPVSHVFYSNEWGLVYTGHNNGLIMGWRGPNMLKKSGFRIFFDSLNNSQRENFKRDFHES